LLLSKKKAGIDLVAGASVDTGDRIARQKLTRYRAVARASLRRCVANLFSNSAATSSCDFQRPFPILGVGLRQNLEKD